VPVILRRSAQLRQVELKIQEVVHSKQPLKLALKDRAEINFPEHTIVKPNAQRVRPSNRKRLYFANSVPLDAFIVEAPWAVGGVPGQTHFNCCKPLKINSAIILGSIACFPRRARRGATRSPRQERPKIQMRRLGRRTTSFITCITINVW
jgi:hypothetical protein